MSNRRSQAFFGSMQPIHRTGTVTDDPTIHEFDERVVRALLRVNHAEDLLPVLFGDDT